MQGEEDMLHRHLENSENDWSLTAVSSILERGSDRDVIDLLRTVRREPFGRAAEAVLRSVPHLNVYGYPALFRTAIARWRAEKHD